MIVGRVFDQSGSDHTGRHKASNHKSTYISPEGSENYEFIDFALGTCWRVGS